MSSPPGPPRFSAVVFDFGDTLFHSPNGAEALVEAGLDRDRAQRLWDELWIASKTAEELAKGRDRSAELHRGAWLDLLGRLEPYAPGIAEHLYDNVIHADAWEPYPDALGVLRALCDRGVRVGVLSNIASSLRPLFERHGLAPYVEAYVESFRHGREKPDPALFQAVCGDLRVAPAAALMVGDSHLADGAAVLTGMTVLLLPPVPPRTPRGLARVLDLVR
ncbi:MAG: HAD family hydrolase [Chloroflexi bacterium]|nr:MAG: HAD family hydrolase [Chloroflexota bacterium]